MSMFTVRADFSDLRRKLDDLREYVRELPKVAIKAMSVDGSGYSRVFVRKDTHSLEKSIRTIPVTEEGGVLKGGWTAGGWITNPKSGRIVDYQLYQELYCPYMRPAASIVAHDAWQYFRWVRMESII